MNKQQIAELKSMTVPQLVLLAQMDIDEACDCEWRCSCPPPHLLSADGRVELHPWMAQRTLRDMGVSYQR